MNRPQSPQKKHPHHRPHAPRPHAEAQNAPESAPIAPSAPVHTTFAALSLAEPLQNALKADGYERPTPIQAQAIPPALDGRDLLGIAQTGTGKTAAFALPILNRLLATLTQGEKPRRGRRPRALVLAPTRELAAQIAQSFDSYGRHTPLRTAVIFGGVGQNPQVTAIRNGLDVLVATPGRLIDLHQQGLVELSEVEFLVLDEADRMLDMGFIEPIRRIAALLPRARQSMLFSATMPSEIRRLADSLLTSPVTVQVAPQASTVDRIEQKLYYVLKEQKPALLVHLLSTEPMDRTVVFTKTKHGADRLVRKLKAAGIAGEAIHGNKGQNQRIRALDAFRSGRVPVLVATDVAARGLDVDDVTHVVNYDLPMEPESYVHRIGRTARAGKSGAAIAFCDAEERDLLKQVERLIKREIPRERMPAQLVAPTVSTAAKAALDPLPPREESRRAEPRRAEQPRGERRDQSREQSRGQSREQPRGGGRDSSRAPHGGPSKGAHPSERRDRPRDDGSRHTRGNPQQGGSPRAHHPLSSDGSARPEAEAGQQRSRLFRGRSTRGR